MVGKRDEARSMKGPVLADETMTNANILDNESDDVQEQYSAEECGNESMHIDISGLEAVGTKGNVVVWNLEDEITRG
ncbi:hypothetical protein QYF36_021856 [Acer negundo]|nr:hypothetical protein QYF36_021856 [Acer negundo]